MSPISTLTALAPAKINLYLHVVGRRSNGYHELDSLIAFSDLHDVIRVDPAETLTLTLEGPFAHGLEGGANNLVLRAAMALADQAGRKAGASITLSKNLPVASGIGGGSADAAATLRILNRFWQVGLDGPTLSRLGQSLGADVPVCLFGQTARVQGIGEKIEPGPALPDIGLLLVNPGVGVSTAAVFSKRRGAFSSPADLPASFDSAESLVEFLSHCHNDLLASARELSPQIDLVLADIVQQPDCLFASLSGSGATCFGLFADGAAAYAAASALQVARPGWWVEAGKFLTATPPPTENP
ncbi:MAG: 4-(cytidine 5'-diphospho)-2-C-methyl-D-erythritol kinase [Proteobacteria bacterium]|nr:4-(cytidine 5'-diphospho)-2-C-methyl-D-erythritol kinase [Pseudomonadota bacterium]